MAENIKDLITTALQNAHSLETQAVQILERQSERSGDYPTMQQQLQRHLEESRDQRQKLEQLINKRDSSTSTLKNAAMGLAANVQAMMHAATEDEPLKNAFASYAFEHFEMASYRSLIAMAKRDGDSEVEQVCHSILEQEERMADWLGNNLDEITNQYIERQGHA